jgi:threonine dehydratase
MDIPAKPPSLLDVVDAARLLAGQAVRTPLLRCPELDRLTGGTVLVKPEVLQLTGSFKFRGAYNALARIPAERRASGVVAWSSGNHAQGVAEAARRLGMPAVIVMPSDAPAVKVDATWAGGAEIVFYDRLTQDREEIGRRVCAERGATLIPSYDHPHVIAGQGTVGLEMARDAEDRRRQLEVVAAPCSGGGLVTGMALGLKGTFPDIFVHAVEPVGFDDMARSLALGERVRNRPGAQSSCDALLAPTPGDLTFPLARRLLAGGLAVEEEAVFEAMRFAFRHMKLVVEPGGAVALAALLSGVLDVKGRTAAIVLSGGNVDPALFARVLDRA